MRRHFYGPDGEAKRDAMIRKMHTLADAAGYRPRDYVSADFLTLKVLAAWRAGKAHGHKRHTPHMWNGMWHAESDGRPSIWTDGVTVWSYGTAILQRAEDGSLLFNATTYSRTTSKRQHDIAMLAREYVATGETGDYGPVMRWRERTHTRDGERFRYVHNVPIGTRDLAAAHARQHAEEASA